MKFTETAYLNPQKTILKFPDHYLAMPVTVNDVGVIANSEGRKIVPAGSIIGATGVEILLRNAASLAIVSNDAKAEGVLLNDVDVTAGPTGGALLVHGFVNMTKLAALTPTIVPSAAAITALAGRITFIV